MINKRKWHARKGVVIPATPPLLDMPNNYVALLEDIKSKIQQSRLKTVVSVNTALILLYWEIGIVILQRQASEGWGAKVIDRLSFDLKEAFPDMKGFSPRNLKYMRAFAAAYPDREFVQRVVAQIPWRSNLTLLDKLKEPELRAWYAQHTLQHGWSQSVLHFQIQSSLHLRIAQAQNNFPQTLPPDQSDMAVQIFKDPYIFDFLGTDTPRRELDIEKALIAHVEKFLLELGQGFAFVGRQVQLEVGNSDFRLDLLFYHLKLRCFVVIELKTGKLEPGHVSQLGFYMNVVDDVMKHADDQPTIGLLLVRDKDHVVAEYCLQGYTKPIGISEWQDAIQNNLPQIFRSSLPSIEEIEAELDGFGQRNGDDEGMEVGECCE